jgi:hypothetical protein
VLSNAYNILVRKCEGNKLFGRTRRRRGGNIKMDLKRMVWEGVDWFTVAEVRE